MIKKIKLISSLFAAFFVIVSGTWLLPDIAAISNQYFPILYAISIIITAIFFILLGTT